MLVTTKTPLRISLKEQTLKLIKGNNKPLRNARTLEENDGSRSSVNINEPVSSDTDASLPTIDQADETSMEEIREEPNVEDNDIENTSEDEAPNFKTLQNTYMVAHQIQEKWETAYPFAMYTAKQKGWLCNICAEYGEGTEQ